MPQRVGEHGSKQYPKSLHRPEKILWLPPPSARHCHCTTHVALPSVSLLRDYSQVQCGRNVSESLSPSHMPMPLLQWKLRKYRSGILSFSSGGWTLPITKTHKIGTSLHIIKGFRGLVAKNDH